MGKNSKAISSRFPNFRSLTGNSTNVSKAGLNLTLSITSWDFVLEFTFLAHLKIGFASNFLPKHAVHAGICIKQANKKCVCLCVKWSNCFELSYTKGPVIQQTAFWHSTLTWKDKMSCQESACIFIQGANQIAPFSPPVELWDSSGWNVIGLARCQCQAVSVLPSTAITKHGF